jgi:hypothetical protein
LEQQRRVIGQTSRAIFDNAHKADHLWREIEIRLKA